MSDDKQLNFEQFGRLAFEELTESLRAGSPDVDADTLANMALRCGLMSQVAFDSEKHGDSFFDHDYEDGDIIYWWGD